MIQTPNAGSDRKTNKEDDSNTLMEIVSDETIFRVGELLNGRLKGCFVFNLSHRKLNKSEVSLLSN